MEPRVNI